MEKTNLKKSFFLMLFLVVLALVSWEIRLRKIGVKPTYDIGDALWSDKRAKVYGPMDTRTVFIGSSRIHFDIDIPTWEQLTGTKAIQLGRDGSSPLAVLYDLAEDPKFAGRLVIDVTEGLFFSTSPFYAQEPDKSIKYFKEITPAQRASFLINKPLEANLVFLDKENFSMNAYIAEIKHTNRPGIFEMPIWPWQFGGASFDNQESMHPQFVKDTNLQVKVRNIWAMFAKMGENDIPIHGKSLDSLLATIKSSVDKIRARGGQVFFSRTPSSGPYLMGEEMGFPRDKYWQRILDITNSKGMHFKDYAATKDMQCPEWSHLTPELAIVFTKELVKVMQQEKLLNSNPSIQ